MPKKDIYHQVVVDALTKDGWVITDDPLHLAYGGRNLYVDLGASQPIAAQKGEQKIAVEIKSFITDSDVYQLEHSIGQYRVYRNILSEIEPERLIYLAIPLYTYKGIFQEPLGQLMIRQEALKLIVFDEQKKEVTQWIP